MARERPGVGQGRTEKKRRGRPWKGPARETKREQINAIVRVEIKELLQSSATRHGRTLSAELEHWIEQLLVYRQFMRWMSRTERTEIIDEAHDKLAKWVDWQVVCPVLRGDPGQTALSFDTNVVVRPVADVDVSKPDIISRTADGTLAIIEMQDCPEPSSS